MSRSIPDLLLQFLSTNQDGYGIFDVDDKLVYANKSCTNIFCMQPEEAIGKTFSDIVRIAFQRNQGIKIETDDIENWIQYALSKRRSAEHRLFEVDLIDGSWLLLSEKLLPSGELLLHTKEITEQKHLEHQLKMSVQRLNKLALTDHLTKIANRRSFIDSVDARLSNFSEGNEIAALMVIDIDHFKTINDQFGHQAGDAALIHVSKILDSVAGKDAVVGRIGGEEFAIFLGLTNREFIQAKAEEIRMAIESTAFSFNRESIHMTISIGISVRSSYVKFAQIYSEADKALYVAKREGRNCCRWFEK